MFTPINVAAATAAIALSGSVLFLGALPSGEADQPLVAGGSPSASLDSAIEWQTDFVDLRADGLAIVTNGLTFTTVGGSPGIDSDPGNAEYWTLEADWDEHDREQRLFLYFGSDGSDWWVDEIRAYDGYPTGEWVYAHGPFFSTPLGESFEGDVQVELTGEGRPDDEANKVPATLSIDGLQLAVSPGDSAIEWQTDVVDLRADGLAIVTNGLTFTTVGGSSGVRSDSGRTDYWTLEADWDEHDREQRLFLYFGSDGSDWWVDEIRAYDGYPTGEWVYAHGPFFSTPLGESFEGDVQVELTGEGRPDDEANKVPATLSIDGLQLAVSPGE